MDKFDVIAKEHALIKDIERQLPLLANIVKTNKEKLIILHQDAFAGDYQDNEYVLLGKAIKYLGLFGKEVRIHGYNRETIK